MNDVQYNWTEERDMEQAYKIGILIGAGIAAIVIVIMLLQKKSGKTFDERQRISRGRAYKAGFYTLMVYMFIYGITDYVGMLWCDTLTGLGIGVIAGTAAFSLTAIQNDSFLGVKENIRSWLACNIVIALINLGIGIFNAIGNRVIRDGVLSFYSINFFVAGLFLLIFPALLIRAKYNESNSEDEED